MRRCAWKATPAYSDRRPAAEASCMKGPADDVQSDRRHDLMRHVVLVPCLAILTAACQFAESRYLGRTVRFDELVGNWRATPFAIKSLRDIGVRDHLMASEHTLVFRADGSCAIQTFMNMPALPAPDYQTYRTGCRWRIGRVGEHQALIFDLEPSPLGGRPYYYFAEEDGQLLLWQHATDPDAWRYMEFEKNH